MNITGEDRLLPLFLSRAVMSVTVGSPEAQRALQLQHKIRLSDDPTAPLVYLVHGRAGNHDVMWAFRRCIPEACSIIAPQAPLPDNAGGFSWWDIGTTSAREGSERAASILLEFMNAAESFYRLKPRTRLACGFSQGAGLLSAVIQREACFAGVGLLAGFVVETAPSNPLPRGPGGQPTAVFMAHGTDDEIVPVEKARAGRDHLLSYGFPVEYVEDPVGHKVGTGAMKALTRWFSSFELGIAP